MFHFFFPVFNIYSRHIALKHLKPHVHQILCIFIKLKEYFSYNFVDCLCVAKTLDSLKEWSFSLEERLMSHIFLQSPQLWLIDKTICHIFLWHSKKGIFSVLVNKKSEMF